MESKRINLFLSILSYRSAFNIKIKYKNESLLMKIIGFLMFFNKDFMTKYITTIGGTIYIPKNITTFEDKLLPVLSHEYVHIIDSIDDKLYNIKYLFPQILAPLMLFFGFLNWWLAASLFIIMLAPLPSIWRKRYELRGYQMSIFALDCIYKEMGMPEAARKQYLKLMAEYYNKQFTGAGYYFMWAFGVEKELDETVDKVISGDILASGWQYEQIRHALAQSKT
jgi:uncharacterized membrane protein YphA (DoxX/SURF4 family)